MFVWFLLIFTLIFLNHTGPLNSLTSLPVSPLHSFVYSVVASLLFLKHTRLGVYQTYQVGCFPEQTRMLPPYNFWANFSLCLGCSSPYYVQDSLPYLLEGFTSNALSLWRLSFLAKIPSGPYRGNASHHYFLHLSLPNTPWILFISLE